MNELNEVMKLTSIRKNDSHKGSLNVVGGVVAIYELKLKVESCFDQ